MWGKPERTQYWWVVYYVEAVLLQRMEGIKYNGQTTLCTLQIAIFKRQILCLKRSLTRGLGLGNYC